MKINARWLSKLAMDRWRNLMDTNVSRHRQPERPKGSPKLLNVIEF